MILKKYFIFLLGLWLLSGCKQDEPAAASKFFFNTACKIIIPAGQKNARKAIDAAFNRIAEIDKKFNTANPASPLYAFNNAGTPIRDKETIALVATVLKIGKETNGAFDPTVYPLVKLWGFHSPCPSLPKANDIKNILPVTGPNSIIVRNEGIFPLKKGAGLDLGGVIPGYAADEALKVLKSKGITSALIDTGGEFFALGTNEGRKWRIGIKNPRGEGIIGVIELENEALATSGDYENFFIVEGKRYHHILDPASGYPPAEMQSVTVICPTAIEADAWSTAFFVLGEKRGFSLLDKKSSHKAIAVNNHGKMIISPQAQNQFRPCSTQND